MCQPCVTNSLNKLVNMARAHSLMDKALFRDAIGKIVPPDDLCDLKVIWDEYCHRHLEKYGKPFVPDVDPNWERG